MGSGPMSPHRYRIEKLWVEEGQEFCPLEVRRRKASVLRLIGQWDQALMVHRRNLEWLAQRQRTGLLAGEQLDMADLYGERQETGEVENLIKRSLKIFRQQADPKGELRAVISLGACYYKRGDYVKAIEVLHPALSEAERIGELELTAAVHRLLGAVHYCQSDYPRALEHYQQELRLLEASGSSFKICQVLGNIGQVLRCQGRVEEAGHDYRRQLETATAMGDTLVMGRALGNIGQLEESRGNAAAALECYRRYWKMAQGMGDRRDMSYALNNMASALFQQGRVAESEDYHLRALAIAEELGDRLMIGLTSGNLGNICKHRGYLKQAEVYYSRAIDILRDLGNLYLECKFLYCLADLHAQAGRRQEALALAEEAAEKAEACGRRDIVDSSRGLRDRFESQK